VAGGTDGLRSQRSDLARPRLPGLTDASAASVMGVDLAPEMIEATRGLIRRRTQHR
jgi:hypothetical protein